MVFIDDMGWGDLSCFGNTKAATPEIDRLAAEGTLFTQFYVNGTTCSPTRTGLMTGHFPAYHHYHFNPKGAETYPDGSPTKFLDPKLTLLPKLLQSGGYATALFGKWHLGASGNPQSPPPSAYGLDEYCTHGYEPHRPRYHDRNKGETRELWSKLTGMIIDDSIDFAKRHKDKPFFLNVWTYLPHAILNPTDEQLAPFEYLNPPSKYTREKTGTSPFAIYYASVYNLDQEIGRLMKALDDPGLSENTLVTLTSDNGPEDIHLPSASNAAIGTAGPFRGRKRSLHEGGIRTPLIVRWPGKFETGKTLNGIVTHQEWLPTLLAAAGEPDVKDKLLKGHQADGKTFHVHIDGYNILPYLLGETDECPRNFFFYTNDDGGVTAIRIKDWKVVFMEQRAKGMLLWAEPFVELRVPKIFNLRRDPFERADESSNTYWDWWFDHIPAMYAAQALTAEQIQSFIEFPPRQKPASFNLDAVLAKMQEATDGSLH